MVEWCCLSGVRLFAGVIVFGIAVPLVLFFLLDLTSLSRLLTIAAVTFISWGITDLLASILEKPRLRDRSPGRAFREDLERRSTE